jgi:polyisoprenoid-binding protein YceI
LKTDSYSNIIFKLTEFKKSQNNLFHIRGKLIIAGVTREIKFEVKGEMLNNGDLKFTGNKSLAMSDYNVEPPTLMFGSITTGNKINISFTAIYEN